MPLWQYNKNLSIYLQVYLSIIVNFHLMVFKSGPFEANFLTFFPCITAPSSFLFWNLNYFSSIGPVQVFIAKYSPFDLESFDLLNSKCVPNDFKMCTFRFQSATLMISKCGPIDFLLWTYWIQNVDLLVSKYGPIDFKMWTY